MENLNSYIEHTILKPDTKKDDVERVCLEAIKYNFLGVCINPNFVKFARTLLKEQKVVTVVNFPLASNGIDVIKFQVERALNDGADEIDTVLNISALKDKNYEIVSRDIKQTKEVCANHNLKVILETDLLTKEEIKTASKIAAQSGADFVKTSTGFVKNGVGARVEDVKIMYETVHPYGLQVKASGGIKDYTKAIDLINAGASRLGTSSGVLIMQGEVQNV